MNTVQARLLMFNASKKNSSKGFTLIELLVVLVNVIVVLTPIMLGAIALFGGGYKEDNNVRGKIQLQEDIQRDSEGRINTRYRLFVSDPKTLQPVEQYLIADDYLRGIWNSGTVVSQAKLHDGSFCEVDGVGRRVPFMSWYPYVENISCQPRP